MRALNQPQSWWGWHGWASQPVPLSVTEILRAGTMPPELAALFWVSMEQRASLLLVADPPSAGKTTILTALLAFLPPETRVYFTRGWGETFDLPPLGDGVPTYIMVNEMSDELPVYSWGPYVVRIFELLAEGYSVGSTMHADTVQDAIAQLEDDAGVPPRHLAHLTYIGAVDLQYVGGRVVRRLNEVALLGPRDGTKDDLSVTTVSTWEAERNSFRFLDRPECPAALASALGMPAAELLGEVQRRGRFLSGLVRDGVLDHAAVENAIARYGPGTTRAKGAG